MKNLIIILFIVLTYNTKAQINTIEPDKQLHIYAGATISGLAFYGGNYLIEREMNPIAPSLLVVAGAAGKEFYDAMGNDRFSYEDFAYTVISGIVVNIVLNCVFNPRAKRKKQENLFNLSDDALVKIDK